MFNIIKRQFSEQLMGVIYYIAGLSVYGWLMVYLFPKFSGTDIGAMLEQYPEDIKAFIGESGVQMFSTIEGFLSVEFIGISIPMILAFYVAGSAGSAIAGMIEKKTMDFNLSQPVSRTKMVLSHGVVTLAYSALISFTVFLMTYFASLVHNVDMSFKGLMVTAFISMLLLWAFYGIAILLSSIFKKRLPVIGALVAFALLSYIYDGLSNAVDVLKDYSEITFYTMYDSFDLMTNASVNWWHVLIYLGVAVVGTIGALIIFNKKDV